jgi:hypothetical protein
VLEILQDESAPNPRKEYDCFGKMVCFHRRYDLGDEHDFKHEDFNGWDELEGHLRKELNAEIVLPLYLYDHSGITMNVTGFSCSWDSGQVGLIYATKEMIMEEHGDCNEESLKKTKELLIAEVATYDQYLQGDVWEYVIKDKDGTCVDSCGGFYNKEYCGEEAKRSLKTLEARIKK